jgi:Flp pilus assembly protein TadG
MIYFMPGAKNLEVAKPFPWKGCFIVANLRLKGQNAMRAVRPNNQAFGYPPQRLKKHRPNCHRRGTVLVLVVFFMSILMGFVALVVDLGYLAQSKGELQRTADSAALGACWDFGVRTYLTQNPTASRSAAVTYAQGTTTQNKVCGTTPALASADIQWGRLSDLNNRQEPLDTCVSDNQINAVKVVLRRTDQLNGPIPTFFARVMGVNGINATAEATAAMIRNVRGFSTPGDGSNLGILPFALDVDTWDNMLEGTGSDNYRYDAVSRTVVSGADGVLEVNLYPQNTGAPGNRGTIDIGSAGNSTADIARQIVYGISPDDLEQLDGSLELGEDGTLELNGDTGISAGVKDELESIKGQPRIIPLFSQVQGPGNNAQFTIVRWVGVRIMNVKLTGSQSSKKVMIQRAPVIAKGAIPATDTEVTSDFVFSTAALVR